MHIELDLLEIGEVVLFKRLTSGKALLEEELFKILLRLRLPGKGHIRL